MSELERMIEERESARKQVKDLNAAIEAERARLRQEERDRKWEENQSLRDAKLMILIRENSKLRALNAVLLREQGLPYKEVAKQIGISKEMARRQVRRHLHFLRLDKEVPEDVERVHAAAAEIRRQAE